MGQIKVENIRIYAHHGCLSEETVIGSEYNVNVCISADLSAPAITDKLSDTIDYVHINHLVKEEMSVPSKLLEHVAKRIIDRIFSELGMVKKIIVSVSKINPPIGGNVEKVTVKLSQKRS